MRYWHFVLAVLLLAACNSGERQRLQLEELERQNSADSLMLNDSLARDLAAWFDRHGTPNEQMRAYYILGRTYADRGEAPQAVNCYLDAINNADTTSTDCDFRTLCRVYSQLAVIYYQQELLHENLRCLDLSIIYAQKGDDKIAAVNSMAQKLGTFDKTHQIDSVIKISKCIYDAFCKLGHSDIASRYMAYAIDAYSQKGELHEALKCMEIYETQSGYFDADHNIEAGREAYYDLKGKYYYMCGKLDSAEYYFRKELHYGSDFNNQNMASYMLAQLYQKIEMTDSATKYALYAYEMNDSTYSLETMKMVSLIKETHDYSTHLHTAQVAKQRAEHEREKTLFLIAIIVVMVVAVCCIGYKIYKRHQSERTIYLEKINELEIIQADVLRLRSHETELNILLHEKENKLKILNEEVNKYRLLVKGSGDSTAEMQLKASIIYKNVIEKTKRSEPLSEAEWHDVNRLIIDTLPEFFKLISSKDKNLGIIEYRTVILLRLHIKPKVVSYMLGYTPQYITKISDQVFMKLFERNGNSKELSEIVSNYY